MPGTQYTVQALIQPKLHVSSQPSVHFQVDAPQKVVVYLSLLPRRPSLLEYHIKVTDVGTFLFCGDLFSSRLVALEGRAFPATRAGRCDPGAELVDGGLLLAYSRTDAELSDGSSALDFFECPEVSDEYRLVESSPEDPDE